MLIKSFEKRDMTRNPLIFCDILFGTISMSPLNDVFGSNSKLASIGILCRAVLPKCEGKM